MLEEGTPVQAGRGYPNPVMMGCTQALSFLGATPILSWGTPAWDLCTTQKGHVTRDWGTPWKEHDTSGWKYYEMVMRYPPPPSGGQAETITFRHVSDAGSRKTMADPGLER